MKVMEAGCMKGVKEGVYERGGGGVYKRGGR